MATTSTDIGELQRQHVQPGQSMRALVFHGTEDVRIDTVPKPDLVNQSDCIIRITATTICGSDLHLYHNAIPETNKGDILGHEFMGRVEKVGSDVTKLQVGDRVIVSPVIACGACSFCNEGRFSLCDATNPSKDMRKLFGGDATAGLFGYSHLVGGYWGGQAQFARVPNADVNAMKVPDELSDEQVLLLTDVLPTAWHGNELIHVGPGDKVAIWGLGPVGLAAVMWAKLRGAETVIGIDTVPDRLRRAKEMGATHVLDYAKEDNMVHTLKSLCPGGGPNKCIDCVGFRYHKTWTHAALKSLKIETDSPEVVNEAIFACRKGGSIALIGDYIAYAQGVPLGACMEKALTITGGQLYCQQYWPKLLEMVQSGKVDPTVLFTHRMNLEDAPKAYEMFDEKKAIKVLLRPWGEEGEPRMREE